MDIFLSRPTWIHDSYQTGLRTLNTQLKNLGIIPRTLGISDYPSKAPLDEVIELMGKCQGAIVLGIPQISVTAGLFKANSIDNPFDLATEWNHLEAALAYSLGLPIVIIKHESVSRGIFDRGVLNAFVHSIDMKQPAWSMEEAINGSLIQWKQNCLSGKGNLSIDRQDHQSHTLTAILEALDNSLNNQTLKYESNVDAASAAFREAMTETQIYLSSPLSSGTRDYQQEATLARLWSKASTAARKHAVGISDQCLEFSRYWANPGEDPFAQANQTMELIESIFAKGRMNEQLAE